MATPLKAPTKYDPSEFITVRVGKGEEMEEFTIHEYYAYRSKFFHCAMNGDWAESNSRIVNMPEDDPLQFYLYVRYLDTARIPADDLEGEWPHSHYAQLAKIYILADQLQDTTTKNAVVRQFWMVLRTWLVKPGRTVIRWLYESTPANSPIRGMLVDMWCHGEFWSDCTQDQADAHLEVLPTAFMTRLICQLGRERNPKLGNTALNTKMEKYMEKE